MLVHLSIQNLAIIEHLELDLKQNMTVLTGETGAGKSIIIDAISLLMGERAYTEMIRHNEESAVIIGQFDISKNEKVKHYLGENEWQSEDELLIKRTIRRHGNGQIRVNGELISVAQLKELGRHLVDIHVQHDTHRLFHVENNVTLIDQVDPEAIKPFVVAYTDVYKLYSEAKHRYQRFKQNRDEILKRVDLLSFQKNEIEKYKLRQGEEDELEERRSLILNSDRLHQSYAKIKHHLNGEGGIIETLYDVLQMSQLVVTMDESMTQARDQVADAYYNLEELVTLFDEKISALSYSPAELDEIEGRLNDLQQLKRKYRLDVEGILAYYDQITDELSQVDDSESYEKQLYETLISTHGALLEAGDELFKMRQRIANQIETQLISELVDLQLFNAQFAFEFTRLAVLDPFKCQATVNGLDEVVLLLSTNKGEPMKPLQKVASGGELSRIMLALKTILNATQSVSTVIFDEIDTGVSGQVASSIGQKMKQISKTKQVICISHLPQVASLATHHLHVSKHEKNNRTTTSVAWLGENQRLNEIARMLSGDNVTQEALENAKQLLAL